MLLTGKVLVEGYNSIKSKEFIFVEASTYSGDFKEGVYKIELATGKVKIFN